MKFELGLSSFAELSPVDGTDKPFTAQKESIKL